MKCSSRRKFVSSSLPITCLPYTDTCNSTVSDESPHGSGTPSPSGTYNQTNPSQLVRITPPLTERLNVQLVLQKQDRMDYSRWIELWTRKVVLTTSIHPFHTLHMNDHELQQITRLRMIATITMITRRAKTTQRMREVIWKNDCGLLTLGHFHSLSFQTPLSSYNFKMVHSYVTMDSKIMQISTTAFLLFIQFSLPFNPPIQFQHQSTQSPILVITHFLPELGQSNSLRSIDIEIVTMGSIRATILRLAFLFIIFLLVIVY